MQAAARPAELGKAAPRVSIVLPLYNSSKELSSALSELDKQSYHDREIVLVDDGSSDGTWDAANALTSGRSDVLLVRTGHRGPAHARNEGLSISHGDIVFFSESDCVYDPAYLQRAVDALDSEPEAAAVCLTGAPLITRPTLATSCIDIENKVQHRLLERGKIEPFYAWVFRRSVLMKLGGFDDRLFQGEDRDLFTRLKNARYTVAWVPGVNWQHIRDQTLSQMASKWFSRGRTRLLYLIKHRRALDMLKSLLPVWAAVAGALLLFWYPLVGAAALLLVAALFLGRTLQTMKASWPLVQKKRSYLGYPIFILVRNFSTGLGYSIALVTVLRRRIQGKATGWENL
ncbi:MAG TPA: glycosyltransferase [Nitrososphaerales archaeon]|nr:glycosyltransferase [Nitrososphaerales archaeon]